MARPYFPFSAIVGQQESKRALIYTAVNPRTGGLLLCGQKGCAKSTLVRAFGALDTDIGVTNLPLNITEDMLFGYIDIKSAVINAKKKFIPGVLKNADGNILYIDEVNLLPKSISDGILDVCQSGCVAVEREGVSDKYSTRFVLVGTMNPEEGQLGSQFTDRFGLCVQIKSTAKVAERVEIIKRRMDYEKDPEGFCIKYKNKDDCLAEKIKDAKQLLDYVSVSDEMIDFAAKLSHEACAPGHRAEIYIVETALAAAAYDKRTEVIKEDVIEAVKYVLAHRIRERVELEDGSSDLPQEENQTDEEISDEVYDKNRDNEISNDENKQNNIPPQPHDEDIVDTDEDLAAGSEIFALNDIFPDKKRREKKKGSGRRIKTVSGTDRGRYIGFTFPKGNAADIALDATLRAAALKQNVRDKKDIAVCIKKEDIRIKKREHRVGNTIFFAVDASGSMGAKKRMAETKNAVISLLYDAYQKRDKVGFIAFRKDSAEILLPVTRSVDLAKKRLQTLPTGGRTPLAKGITASYNLIYSEMIKDSDMIPLFILITDGKANDIGMDDPYLEAVNASKKIAKKNIPSIVIDTEKSKIPLGIAKDVSDAMNAEYYKMDEIKAEHISSLVKSNFL